MVAETTAQPRMLIDTYLEWVAGEGIPVLEDFGFDLLTVETQPWARTGARGAYTHLKGRGDFLNMYVLEIPPGGATTPQKHLYEALVYVLDGRGSTLVETPDGERHSFEWGTGSLFALPLNVGYRFFNASGAQPARLAAVTNLPLILNVFRNHRFIWDNDFAFDERLGEARFFKGDGEFIRVRPGRHMWVTNFVPDLPSFKLEDYSSRGAGSSNMKFVLADGTMHAHMSEMPVGTYKKAHRHGADFHIFPTTGHGYSLLWYEGQTDLVRVDWRHGSVYAPPDQMYHQHFNTATAPSRYLAVAFGGLRYPVTTERRLLFLKGSDTSVKEGGNQIEYEDEAPRVREIFLAELAKHGVEHGMQAIWAQADEVRRQRGR